MSTDYIDPDTLTSLHDLFRHRAHKDPQRTAYQYYDRDKQAWQSMSWQSVLEHVDVWSAALAKENLQAGDRVAILIRNSVEWVLFEQASFANQLVVVPLFPEDRAENIAYCIRDAGVKVLFVNGAEHIEMLASVAGQLQDLQRIICLQPGNQEQFENKLVSLQDWLHGHEAIEPQSITDRNSLASIVYTSGTTGKPKGVMLSHNNILQNAWAGIHSVAVYPDDHFLSFLPISHMLERTVGYYMPMMSGAKVSFSRSIGELAEDIVTLNPSVLITVPRIFERFHNKVHASLSSKSGLIQGLFKYATDLAWRHFEYQQLRTPWKLPFLLLPLFDRLFFKKIRAHFGTHFRFAICGGAALDSKVARLFIAIGLPIAQGYGLTEYSPVISVNRLKDNEPASVGRPLPGVEVCCGDNDELLVRGECMMMGYWQNKAATQQIIDAEGWLHTGDKVRIDDDRIYITGRLKDIIVLSTGEKVPPCEIEQSILQDPIFENVVVIGENRPYLGALVIPNYELAEQMKNGYASLNAELLDHIKIKMKAFPGYARIHKIGICKEPWTVDNGLLTPTLKPKRQQIIDHNRDLVEQMYTKP